MRSRPSHKKKRSRASANFNAGLHFIPLGEPQTILFLLTYALCYSLVIICLLPVLRVTSPTDEDGNGIPDDILEGARGRETARHAMQAVRGTITKIKEKSEAMDMGKIILSAEKEYAAEKDKRMADLQSKREKLAGAVIGGASIKDGNIIVKNDAKGFHGNGFEATPAPFSGVEREGFMVLGMHRSGTSMLSGLLVTGMGYNTGGPLIGASFDNEKGFFERVDVVLQNDEFFRLQNIDWAANVVHYDWQKALEDKKSGRATFQEGEKGLQFLNNEKNAPWLQKDPRMCIALRTWLELLNNEPAVVFTYRHPLEVAMSLKKREAGFHLERGFRLWIVYNMRAIENSAGLCRILSSNEEVFANPLKEVQRISDELTRKCGVPPPPQRLDQHTVDKFIDPKLQHNKKETDSDLGVLENFGNGCVAKDFHSDFLEGTQNRKTEVAMYLKAMQVYCDLKTGDAYREGYKWPSLVVN